MWLLAKNTDADRHELCVSDRACVGLGQDLGAGRMLGAVNREETTPWRLSAVRLGSGVGRCRR
jgi:hypothetical protein